MKSSRVFLIFCVIAVILGGYFSDAHAQVDNGRLVVKMPYETEGERHFFVTPTGGGSCSSWMSPCTFRQAVSKLSSNSFDVIHLSPGAHNTDNGSDANGTTISTNYTQIEGIGMHPSKVTLYNGAATADYILIVTGNNVSMRNILFTNAGRTDTDVTHLNVRGNNFVAEDLDAYQVAGATGTGILLDNGTYNNNFLNVTVVGMKSYGIRTNSCQNTRFDRMFITWCATGVSLAGGINDANMEFDDVELKHNSTIGMAVSANVTGITMVDPLFSYNDGLTNVTDLGAWNGLQVIDPRLIQASEATYPANAGVAVASGDGAWVWSVNPVTIIPASTIHSPIIITGINTQADEASKTYKVQVLYGQVTADTAWGTIEFTTGVGASKMQVNSHTTIPTTIPSNSVVGVKIEASVAGISNLTLTLSYIML